MGILIKIIQLILSLALLVFIHELGHFLFAKLFKIRVNKFYLFFDIKGALLRYKPKNSETEYGIGWLPLGGYCQIDGMVDESLALEGLESEPKPWEFRAHPTWQRLLVMLGGVLFNVILAILIYGGMAYAWGTNQLPIENVGDNLTYSSVGHDMGLKDGDLPIAIDGKEIKYFEGFLIQEIANGDNLTVLRDNQPVDIVIPADFMRAVIASQEAFFMLDLPARIDSVAPNSAALRDGLKVGDTLVAVNAKPMNKLSKILPAIQELKGDSITLKVKRGEAYYELRTMPDKETGLGIGFTPPVKVFEQEHTKYGALESIPAGVHEAAKQIASYTDQLKYVATPEGASSLGGLGTMGSLFSARFDWNRFWNMTAFLSVILAVMNILPIPGLDGGHIMFIIYEVIVGKAPSLKWQTRFQLIGMLFLIFLVLYANINDIFRFFM
ncbi:RIP metalloprotease RseP [Porphyromonadaceae bacterium W3.11]|nr:RIP metalloprotease RseP [Porphyromonadaceae bacterium W3.11]